MDSRRTLAQQLGVVAGFDDPRVDLEQYTTPPELAANIVHVADLQDDIEGRTIVDLGTGTGMLALAAALRGPELVVGVELDRDALETALRNERRVATSAVVEWIRGDATRAPLATDRSETTVLMNPPFGAQNGNEGIDGRFLSAARELASISYSVHNEGSREFVESFAHDHGGEIVRGFRAELEIDNTYHFHDSDSETVDAEIFKIRWE